MGHDTKDYGRNHEGCQGTQGKKDGKGGGQKRDKDACCAEGNALDNQGARCAHVEDVAVADRSKAQGENAQGHDEACSLIAHMEGLPEGRQKRLQPVQCHIGRKHSPQESQE